MSRFFGRALVLVVAATLLGSPLFAATGEYRAVVLADNPAAYYPLDETSGTQAIDIAGTTNGTYNNVTLGNGGALGSATAAGTFNGSNSYISLPGTWVGGTALTIEAWVNIAGSTGQPQTIVGATSTDYVSLNAATGNTEYYIDGGGPQTLGIASGAPGWQHVVVVIQSGFSALYINGSQVSSNVSSFTSIDTAFGNLRIGAGQSPGRWLNGLIDEVAIYNYALPPARISAHFAAQPDGPITSVASGNWSSGATWNTGTIPMSDDDVVINGTHTVTVDTASVTVNDLTVLGTLDVSSFGMTVAKDLTVAGTINGTAFLILFAQTAGTQLTGLGTINAPLSFSDTLQRSIPSGESLDFTNTVTVDSAVSNGGEVTLTHASGLTGSGTWNQGSTGTLHIEGPISVAAFSASTPGNLVDFTGGSQFVRSTTYHDLTATGNFESRMLSGPITVNGDLSIEGGFYDEGNQITGGSGTLSLADLSELHIGTFSGPGSSNGTLLPAFNTYAFDPGSDVSYNALASQTVDSTPTYGNLTVQASNTPGLYVKTADGPINVTGFLSVFEFIADVEFDIGPFVLTVGGELDGGGTIDTAGGAVRIGGDNVNFTGTITPNYDITFNGTGTQNIRSAIYNAVTIDKTAGTAQLAGTATMAWLAINDGEFYDNNFTLNGGVGTLFMAADTTLRLAASMPSYSSYPIALDSTVIYEGDGAQVIDITPLYGHVIVTTGATPATKTLSGAAPFTLNAETLAIVNGAGLVTLDMNGRGAVVAGDVTGNGELNLTGGGALTLGGDFIHTGTFYSVGSSVTYNGGGAQIVRGAAYEDLIIDKIGGTATLAGNASAADECFINDGTFNLGSYALDSQDVVLVDTPGTLELGTGVLKIAAYLILDGTFDTGTTGELWITGSIPAVLSGAAASMAVHNLRITNVGGMELDEFAGFDITVSNLLDLSGGGNVYLKSPRKLTIGSTGALNRVAGAVQGMLSIAIPAGQTRRFEMATYSSNTYSPIEITSSNAATINVVVTDASATQKVDRFWTLSGDPSTLDLKYEWDYSGYTGDTRGFVPARFFSSTWTFPAGYVDVTGDPSFAALVDGVSAYEGDWTAGNAQFLGEIVPSIGSFDPTLGADGTSVVLYGSNFTGATAVAFNGTSDPGFSVGNDNELYTTVPVGATTGTISVTSPSGTGTSYNNFTVAVASTIQTLVAGNWSDTGTWQGGVVPNPWDNAVINHNVTMDVFATINDVQLNANLDGGFELTVDGTMTWNSGLITSGLELDNGAVLDIATLALHEYAGPELQNGGTININTASLYISNGAILTNNGTININGDFDLVWNNIGASTSIENGDSGVIAKIGGAGTSALGGGAELNNVGVISAEAGTLNVTSDITTAGLVVGSATSGGRRITTNPVATQGFQVANGATMQFSAGGDFQSNTDFSGAGTFLFNSAVDFHGNISASATNFIIDANATFDWDTVIFTGALTAWNQGVFTGELNVAPGSTVTVAPGIGSHTLDGINFYNEGTVTLAASLILTNGAAFTNDAGNVNIQGDHTLNWNSGGATAVIQNSGTIAKTAGGGMAEVGGGATFASDDTLRSQSGTLRVSSPGIIGGTIDAANPGTTVEFNTVPSFADEATFSGGGTILVNSGGTFTGDIHQTANLFRIDTTGAITLTGVIFNGDLEWKDATISGDTLQIAAGSVWTVSAGTQVPVFDTLDVTNYGTINLAGESLALADSASLDNEGTVDIQGDFDLRWNAFGAPPDISNPAAGTIKKSAGTSTSTLGGGASVANTGTIQSDSGTLNIDSDIVTNGTFAAAPGAIVSFTGTGYFNNFTIFSGNGTFNIDGNATFADGITATTTGTVMLRGNNTKTFTTATVTGTLHWKESSITGSGLTIPALSTLNVVTGTQTPKLDAGALTIAGSMNVGTTVGFRNAGSFILSSGGTVAINGDYDFGYDGTGAVPTFTLSGLFGKTGGTGTSNVNCGTVCTNTATGTIGAATGTLAFTTGLTSNGTLKFPINGPTPLTDFGRIDVTGTVNLAGTSNPEVNVGYVPDGGTAFQVLTFDARIGDFATKNYTFAGTRTLSETYTPTDLTLTASGPVIGTLTPASGGIGGGTVVTINGTGFTGTTPGENFTGTVLFDTTLASPVLWQSATELTATTPAHGAGAVNVTVTNASSESHTKLNAFSYSLNAPVISGLTVTTGTVNGGTYTEISGTNLSSVTQVQFDGVNATILSTTPILKVRTPAGTGIVDVTVTNPDGSDTLTNGFTYVSPSCTAPSGVMAWFQGSNDANDSAGGTNGTNNGGYAGGKIGQGFALDGASQYVSVPDSLWSRPSPDVTIEGWVNFDSIPVGQYAMLFGKTAGTGTYESYGVSYKDNLLYFGVGGPGGIVYKTTAFTPSTARWYHVALTFDDAANDIRLYVDGQLALGAPEFTSIAYDTHPLTIGAEYENESLAFFFDGTIDEVTVYNRALLANEVLAIYDADTAGKCAPAIPTVLSVTPNSGTTAGGTAVTILGSSLASPTNVTFGGNVASWGATDQSSITSVITPAGTGTVNVTVTTAAGAGTLTNGFTYVAPTTVTSIANGNWNTNSTWDTNTVPTASDTVVIDGETVTLTANATAENLTLSSGSLGGANTLTINGAFNWTGGTLGMGGGAVTVAATGSLTISGPSGKILNNFTINNNSNSSTWAAGSPNLAFTIGAIFNNAGTFTIHNDASITYDNAGAFPAFNNSGTLRKQTTTGTSIFGVGTVFPFNNTGGTLDIQTGILQLNGAFNVSGASATLLTGTVDLYGGGTASTALGAGSGGTIRWFGNAYTINSAWSGTAGSTYSILSGTVTVNGSLSGETINLDNATLGGTGTVTPAAAFNWSGGTLGTGGGTLQIPVTATLNITGAGAKTLINYTIDNDSTASSWAAGASNMLFSQGALFRNDGMFTIHNDSSITYNNSGGFPAFNNNGTLRKQTATGTTVIGAGTPFPLNNAGGTLDLQTGTLQLNGALNVTGTSMLSTGTVDAYGGGTSSGNLSLAAGATLRFLGGTQTITGAWTGAGSSTYVVDGGTVTVTSPGSLSGDAMDLTSGSLGGNGTVTPATSFDWTGGTLGIGAGTLQIPGPATLTISGATAKTLDNYTIDNDSATSSWAAGASNLAFTQGAIFRNDGTFTIHNDSSISYNNAGGFPAFNNNGTLRKQTASGTSIFGAGTAFPFNNGGGILDLQTGTLQLNGAFNVTGVTGSLAAGTLNVHGNSSSSGSFSVVGGAKISFKAGNQFMTGSWSGLGTANIDGGAVNFTAGGMSVATLELFNGTLSGSQPLSANFFTWTGGTLGGGGGSLTVNTGGSMTISGPTPKTLINYTLDHDSGNGLWAAGSSNLAFTQGAVFSNDGTFVIENDASISYDNAGGFPAINNAGTIHKRIATGTSTFGNGTPFPVNSSGTLDIETGAIQVNGTLTLNAPSFVKFGIGGTTPLTTHGQLIIPGSITFAGTINAYPTGVYVPQGGNTYPVITYSSRTGTFVENLGFGAGRSFSLAYNAAAAVLSASGPVVSSVNPTSGSQFGGTTVVISGSAFTNSPAPTVTFGGTSAPSVTFDSANQLTVVTPAHAAGLVDVVVTNNNGEPGTLANAFTFDATVAPTVSAIRPNTGNVAGGTTVYIDGTALDTVTSVVFDTTPGTIVSQTATLLEVTSPAHAAGTITVSVTNPAGSANGSFTYDNVWDVARDFSRSANPIGPWSYGWSATRGGTFNLFTTSTTHGSGFNYWYVGAAPTAFHNPTASPITHSGDVTVPAGAFGGHSGAAGENSVVRWTAPAAGQWEISGAFTGIDQAPTTTDVAVLVQGVERFTGNVNTYNTPQSFTLRRSLNLGDIVELTVGYGNGNYLDDSTRIAATITPLTGPAVTIASVSPAVGPPAGGQSVTITGTNFHAGAGVTFDGISATSIVVVNANTITAVTPAHVAATVDVVVTHADSADATLTSGYTYSGSIVSIGKTAPANVAANEVFTYTITVGVASAVAANVSVGDVMQAGMTPSNISAPSFTCSGTTTLTCTAATLAIGTHTITFDVTAPSSPTAISNVANVTADNDVSAGDNSATAVTNVGAAQADLSVVKTVSNATMAVGGNVTWTITVTNNGPSPATGVTIADTIPDQQTSGVPTPSAGSCNTVGKVVTCNFGGLAVGASANVTIPATLNEAGTHTNSVTASASEGDPNAGNNTATEETIGTAGNTLVVRNSNASGNGSFAQAMLDADAGNCASPCTITFNIPTPAPIPGALPTADVLNLTIDGTTQPGYSAVTRVPLIEIDGTSANPGSAGLNVDGDGHVIRGLAIYGFTGPGASGINVIGGSHTFEANWIGVKPDHSAAPNAEGMIVNSAANLIGNADPTLGNVIAGNTGAGIRIIFGTDTEVIGNRIGIAANGASRPNGTGVRVESPAGSNLIGPSNDIANNPTGVAIFNSVGVVVRGNSIRASSLMAIDHDHDSTLEVLDAGDPDTGSNNHQNAPVISLVEITPSDLDVTLSVDSALVAATQSLYVEIFKAAGGQPQELLGGGCFATNSLVNQLINVPLGSVVNGDTIVATATSYSDGTCTNAGDGTSEVSAAVVAGSCIPPAVTISGDTQVCAGGSVTLDAGLHSSYLWMPGGFNTQTINISPASTTTYTVTVTDGSGCSNSDSHTVTVNTPAPAGITPSGATTFCAGGSVTLTASAGNSFVWSPNGETTPSITVSAAGSYGVTVTDANGCVSTSAPVTVTVNSAPPVTITGPSTSCNGTTVALNATAGFTSYLWQPGNLTGASVNVTPSSTTTYTVTATDANGCTSSSTHTVTVNTAPPVTITGPTTTCSGAPVTLTATGGFTSYLWQPGNLTGPSVTVSQTSPTTYTVTATDANGCTTTDTHFVNLSAPPQVPAVISASGPTTFCEGGSVVLSTNVGGSHLWSTGETTPTITVTTSGTYGVTITDGGGCSQTAPPIGVTVNPPPSVTITGPTATCDTAAVTLDAGAGFNSYLWQPGNLTSQTITVNPSSTTTYTVTVTNASGCSATDTHQVTVSSNPVATITAPALICSGATGHTASVGTTAGATYAWSITNGVITSAANGPSITFDPAGLASVQLSVVVTAGSCTANGSTTVPVSPAPATPVISAPSSVPSNTTGHTASITPQAGASYFWTINGGAINGPNSGSSISFDSGATTPITLSVSVNINGCTSSASVNVPVDSIAPPSNEADLGITKSAPAAVVAGTSFTYTITVTNAGPAAATGLTVVDTLPAGVTLLGVNGGAWDCTTAASQVTCSGDAFAGQFGNILITVRAPSQATTITNSVAVTSAIDDPNTANNSDSVSTIVNVAAPTCPSASPSLTSPANGATNVPSPVTLTWTAVNSASFYDVWITTEGVLTLGGSTSGNSLTISVGAGVSNWYVVAHGSNGCASTTSVSRTFTVAPSPTCGNTAKPQIVSPAAGASVSSPVTISWSPVPQAIGYRVWISVDGTAAQDVGTTNGAISMIANVPAGEIDVFVDALFNACPPSRSDAIHFTVPQPDPCANRGAATLLAPANNSQVNSSSVELSWNAPAGTGAALPQYRVWASVDGAAPAVIGTTNETSLREVFERGQVIWYVENLYPGCASTESPRFNFNIPARNECDNTKPNLVSPAGNATVTNGSVTFIWSGVADAVAYEVWLALGNETPALIGTTAAGVTTFNYSVPPGDLRWHVRALIDRCPARESTPGRFTYAPPAACEDNQRPVAITPVGPTPLTSPADFSWSAPEGATRYELYAHRATQPPALVASTNVPQANDVALAAGSYQWFVRAFFEGCSPLDSASEDVTIVAPAPACAVLASPVISAPGQISSGIPFLMQWTPVLGATSYQLQIASNASFAGAEIINTTATQHELVRTNNGATAIGWYARVRAFDTRCASPSVSPYGPVSAVFVLPQQGTDGAAPLTGLEPITYTINLGPQFAGQSFTAVPSQPWLTVAPASGVVPAAGMNLIVTADTSALGAGTSLGGVTVTLNTTDSSRVRTSGFTTVTSPVSVNLVTPVTPAPKSSPPPDALVIPAVANADGINSHFQSDVRVSNTSPQLMKYQLTYIPSGDAGISSGRQTTFSIEPGRTVALDDILKSWFGTGSASSTGSLEVRPLTQTASTTSSSIVGALANLSTFASSRTFNITPNGTFGQHIPAIPFANFIGKSSNSLLPTVLSLQQIAQSSKYRTNLGLMEGSGQPASLLVKVFGSNGAKLTDFPVSLNGGQHLQLNGVLAQKGITTLSDGRIEVEVLSGGGKVTAYASVLDNETSDPLLVSPITLGQTGNTRWVVPGVADLNNGTANWQTDMRVFNAGASPVTASLAFYSQNGGAAKTTNVTIPAGQVLTFDKTLSTVFGAANDGGAVHITTSADARLIATARTYNQTTQGTYGQFISAVTPLEAAGVETRPLQLLQVEESDRFRSNIGLAEVTGNPAKLEITVVPPDAKFTARIEVDLGPNEFRQIGSLLKTVGLSETFNARVTVRVIEGTGRVAAYASVIDMKTNDPTYVPAQ